MPQGNLPGLPPVNPDNFEGGIGGFKNIAIRPVEGYSATLDMNLRAFMESSGRKSRAGVIAAHWPATLESSEMGAKVLEKLKQIRALEKEVYTIMKQVFVEDNAISQVGQQANQVDGIMGNLNRRLGNDDDQEPKAG